MNYKEDGLSWNFRPQKNNPLIDPPDSVEITVLKEE